MIREDIKDPLNMKLLWEPKPRLKYSNYKLRNLYKENQF